MKKSYIKLVLFIFFFGLLFILNGIWLKFLSMGTMCLLLVFMSFIFYTLCGYEKDRHRYVREIGLEIIITMLTFFLLYYILGIFIRFAKSSNILSLSLVTRVIIPTFIYIVIKELLRYQMVMKGSLSKILLTLVCIFFIVMDICIPLSNHPLTFNREMFLLLSITIVPLITENILCTYLALNFGYKPSMLYLIIMCLFRYMPIIPNPNYYLYSLIFFLFPLFVLYRVDRWLKRDRTEEEVMLSYRKRKRQVYLYLVPIVVTGVAVYFVSGYFRFYAIAIASGSMEDVISKGDVVIVDTKYDNINIGDVIAYNYENRIVVHRVFRIVDSGNVYYIYTKGDANSEYDKYKISKDMVIGVTKAKIPLIGYPTVLLNEKW